MRIFDTHCHVGDPAFAEDFADVVARMRDAGICLANVVCDPCEEEPNQEKVFGIAEGDPLFMASIGVHPHNACRWSDAAQAEILRYLKHPKCRLLGEIGLDYHYDLSPREDQVRVFDLQLDIAYEQDVPVQLHIREAHDVCMDMLRSRIASGRMPKGIVHCFTDEWQSAKFYLDAGLYISFSGAVTFKNARKLQEAAQLVPADRLLAETDCPYMAPVPLRGRRNEPAYIVHTLAKLAELRGESPEKTAEQIYENSLAALRCR